ncbi:MAG: 16S rRNA (cytidine(1402)-2'-O)-methyltransferase [Pseudomonadota bacterium]
MTLSPGLYLVSTPIGNAEDITLRALRLLGAADVLAAEDTRTARRLMDMHGVALNGRPLVAYHDHNGPQARPRLMADLAAGRSVAYVSEAGTPLIADPGYRLASEAIAAGHAVQAAPGASALLAALAVAGLPTDRFLFAGFLPPKSAARRAALADLTAVPATLVFYESPRRLTDSLADMQAVLGDREAAVCRELTKKFEETRRGALSDLAAHYAAPPKGEVVVVVAPPAAAVADPQTLDTALTAALARHSVRDAAQLVAEATGLPRKRVYARALELAGK